MQELVSLVDLHVALLEPHHSLLLLRTCQDAIVIANCVQIQKQEVYNLFIVRNIHGTSHFHLLGVEIVVVPVIWKMLQPVVSVSHHDD